MTLVFPPHPPGATTVAPDPSQGTKCTIQNPKSHLRMSGGSCTVSVYRQSVWVKAGWNDEKAIKASEDWGVVGTVE